VLTTPGHSPGSIALWREADRVLLIGHGPVNLGSRTSPRWLRLPEALNHDLAEAADDLWVDEQLLRCRLRHLHPSERGYLQQRLAEDGH
jgi:glyoxylase-like metal-dependent hydrolase (beta-lactamase superfamily II)